jgi:hypothetical protein
MVFHHTNFVAETNIWWLRRVRPVIYKYLFKHINNSFKGFKFIIKISFKIIWIWIFNLKDMDDCVSIRTLSNRV